jgi:hypothetical protein
VHGKVRCDIVLVAISGIELGRQMEHPRGFAFVAFYFDLRN